MTKEILDKIFKAYDIRGLYPEQLSNELFYNLGRAYATKYKPGIVVVGHDIRPESAELKENLINGLLDSGSDVVDLGEIATEMIYFAVGEFKSVYDGGLVVTASHNPAGWNGCKMIDKNVMAIGAGTGGSELKELMLSANYANPNRRGELSYRDIYPEFKEKIRSFIRTAQRRDLKIVVDAGNGIGGKVFDYVFGDIPELSITRMYFEPDGTYPNHIPNPIEEENVFEIKRKVVELNADLGIAIDGDADRAMFIDKQGRRPDGVYTGVLFAKHLLKGTKGESIIHDPRITWPFVKESENYNARAIESLAGHSFFKKAMSENKSVFGAEMSAHYFYRSFYNADSGMATIATMLDMMFGGIDLSNELDYLYSTYPNSGEVNYEVANPAEVFETFENHFTPLGGKISKFDGISVEFSDWRFNLRGSNTQPLIRLNVEGISQDLVKDKFLELENIIGAPRQNTPALDILK